MRKKILLIVILNFFNAVQLHAANWDLFPLNQKSWFINRNVNPHEISTYVMDSVFSNGISTSYDFFRNEPVKGIGNCSITAIDFSAIGGLNTEYPVDSLLFQNNTTYYYSYFSSNPFYFKQLAQPGDNWNIISTDPNNDYDTINVICTSIQLQTFMGITDSIKTFVLIPYGSSAGQIPVSNFQIKLSKNYGLLEFVPFELFLVHPSYINFYSLELTALETNGVVYGYQTPQFSDYFHLSAGDVLLWKYEADYDDFTTPDIIEYYLDSITQSIITPDSVIYITDRSVKYSSGTISNYTGINIRYFKSEYFGCLESLPGFYSGGNMVFQMTPNSLLWKNRSLLLEIDSLTSDTVTRRSFYSDAISVSASCQMSPSADLAFEASLNTKTGFDEYCMYNWGSFCNTLLAYRINGVQNGNVNLGVNENIENTALKIYPNPARDILYINDEDNLTYKLYSIDGQFIRGGHMDGNEVSIDDLKDGIYLFLLNKAGKNVYRKFVLSK